MASDCALEELGPRAFEQLAVSIPQIAAKLHIAPTTVRTHVQNLYEKLGLSERGAAVAEAMRRRLVE